jgi:hypothetical protein
MRDSYVLISTGLLLQKMKRQKRGRSSLRFCKKSDRSLVSALFISNASAIFILESKVVLSLLLCCEYETFVGAVALD